MVVAFRSGSCSCLLRVLCSNLFIRHLLLHMLRGFWIAQGLLCLWVIFIGFSLFIVVWNITHVAFLQLLAGKEPPCDCIEAQ